MSEENIIDPEHLVITEIWSGHLCGSFEGIVHTKNLPCLSVVQATHGSYDISLDGEGAVNTGEMGVFVAPSGAIQTITHHNAEDGIMQAHWTLINAIVDRQYDIDLVYRFPVILPCEYNVPIFELLSEIEYNKSVCLRYAAAYQLLDILLKCAERKPSEDAVKCAIRFFVGKNYSRRIQADDIAEAIHCSPAQVFRYTKRYFNLSPANYINLVRLQNAARALEYSDLSVKEIAYGSGFNDIQYFSRLFRRNFGRSPQEYRHSTCSET